MKHSIKRKKNHKNTDQTVAWLIQTIECELDRGEEADELLILECSELLQELSPEAVPSVDVTEKYLQAELNGAKNAPVLCRKTPRMAVKIALRLAAVLTAFALFFVAVPVVAAQVLNENDGAVGAPDFLKPVLEILTLASEPESIAYPCIDEYKRKGGYNATYKTTKDLLIKEKPADILCLTDLPEEVGEYEIRVVHYDPIRPDKWRISWSAKDNRWGYLIAYSDTNHLSDDLKRPNYERKPYEQYHANGRTFFYKMQANGSYWATCIQGRVQYSILAPNLETMTLLIDHTASASDIIPSAEKAPLLLAPEEYSPLKNLTDPLPFLNEDYIAYYETSEDFLKSECVDVLIINDHASELGDFWIRVSTQPAPYTSYQWSVTWKDENRQWMVSANYREESTERLDIEATQPPQYVTPYTVEGRTFYITEISPSTQDLLFTDHPLSAKYYEGNMIYTINTADRETLELLIRNLVRAKAE